ncbi:hypothetical protein Tco_0017356 [Tanacetum coccineum]
MKAEKSMGVAINSSKVDRVHCSLLLISLSNFDRGNQKQSLLGAIHDPGVGEFVVPLTSSYLEAPFEELVVLLSLRVGSLDDSASLPDLRLLVPQFDPADGSSSLSLSSLVLGIMRTSL